VKRTPTTTDEEVKAEVERQLREQGIHDATVRIENGRIKIEHAK
jgi:hypothetical protein